jgi:hypothetical protein
MSRPSEYRPEYCERVVELMRMGMGKVEAAADLCGSYHTFQLWQEQNPAFLQAVKEGERLSQAWWERLGREGACGTNPNVNATMYIFNMKNRFKADWADTQRNEHTGKDGGPVKTEAEVTLRPSVTRDEWLKAHGLG